MTQSSFFFFSDFVQRPISKRHMTFWKLALFLFSGKKAPNLVDTLDQIILNQWAPQGQ